SRPLRDPGPERSVTVRDGWPGPGARGRVLHRGWPDGGRPRMAGDVSTGRRRRPHARRPEECRMSDETEFIAAQNASTDGEFVRDATYIGDRVVRPGTVEGLERGGDPVGERIGEMYWPIEAGRYRLMAARACPWASRTIIVRRLMGLENTISMGLAGPTHDINSWTFDLDPDERDPVTGLHRLQTAYFNRIPDYPRGITVPALVDLPTTSVVTNAYQKLNFDLLTEWTDFHRDGAPDLYPEAHRDEIDELDSWIYPTVNNGVYRCGFAAEQGPYEQAYDELWASLDCLEERLSTRRYLVGETITAADIRLFTTLVRFDAVYHGHFKANRQKITEMPALWGHLRDLVQTPGFGDTCDLPQI